MPAFHKAIKSLYSSFIDSLKVNGLQANPEFVLDPEIAATMKRLYTKAGLMGAKSEYRRLTFSLYSGEKAANFGRDEAWIREVLDYLKIDTLKFIQSITETTREDILKIIRKGVEGGWSIDRIIGELESTELSRARARTIARTEIVRASNVGHAAGAKSFPYEVDKKWIAARDHRTRHSHRSVNNHTVDENGTFQVPVYKGDKPTGATDAMKYPGDPDAQPSNTINCRCRVTYIPKRDGKGNLIRRSTTPAVVIPLRPSQGQNTQIGIAASLKAIAANISVDVSE